jgi:TolA-binding protein
VRLWLLGILLLVIPAKAGNPFVTQSFNSFELSPGCRLAYRLIWQYRIDEAVLVLSKESPQNLMAAHLRETAFFIRAFATEAPADIEAYYRQYEKSLNTFSLEEAGKNGWSNYAYGEAHLHHALLSMKQSSYVQAAYDINKAYNNLSSGDIKYKDCLPVQKDLLLLKAAIGSVPDNYRWMVKILGFSGNLKQDAASYIALLRQMKSSGDYNLFYPEAGIYCSYIQYYLLNDSSAAWNTLSEATRDYASSPVLSFFRASMALRLKKNDEAAEVLSGCTRSIPLMPLLDYQYGLTLLQQCDKAAGAYFARFIKNYQGQNYLKDAYLRLGWAFLLNKDFRKYRNCMLLVKKYGTANLEEDANALREASRTELPDINLLKARLFYDGGYYDAAAKLLQSCNPARLNTYNQAEYYYRSGRIAEAEGNSDEALGFYNRLITNKNYNTQSYFSPAACVYSGMIWEKRRNFPNARQMYNRLNQYHDYPYQNSFEQKAKAGLKRLE